MKFINHRDILYTHQYGFLKKHNTIHPVMHFLDKIYNSLYKQTPEVTIGIFMALKKHLTLLTAKFFLKNWISMDSVECQISGSKIISWAGLNL